MNKEPRLRFTEEERADPALEKPIRKAEKAAARADKAQANIPKKKVRQTVIDPDTGKKTSKLTFEDKKKPPSKVSQGVKEAPVHLVAGKLHKEIRETEQDNAVSYTHLVPRSRPLGFFSSFLSTIIRLLDRALRPFTTQELFQNGKEALHLSPY